jgi:hypothetical protein
MSTMSARHRTAVVVAVAVIAALTLLGQSFAAGGGTRVLVYSPLTPMGGIASGIHIVSRTTGYCTTPARSTPHRADTWLCVIAKDGSSYDPCFAPDGQSLHEWAVCPVGDYGSGRFILINLTSPLPATGNPAGDPTTDAPTMVRLSNGNACWLVSDGYAGVVTGLSLDYGCHSGAWLAGPVRRTNPNWTGLYLANVHSSTLTVVKISTAYF